ncbi:MAG: threonine--tRNA ligase [Candidatus Marinimicrobia bacterium]|jgi:threonyl-tRNA synthetase|nr:threonine--tRNA ligase [Candidatus Neomarinimicrobiota bacterium]MDP6853107.1 threonine--tRNA ligase [Candidatus Neomarinimicrobiota bacterium]MDP6936685.1 threonine--tRNA ligase [Candidatus Neomarinimicrobiota bacterium]
MSEIQITLPDESVKLVEPGSTSGDIARSIGEGLFRASIAAKVNGDLVDLEYPLGENTNVEILTNKNPESHEILLHSTAHLLAQAVKELYPGAKIAIGPALEDRFYYDIDVADVAFNNEELEKIEKKMREITKQNLPVERVEFQRNDALNAFKELGEDYKVEIISEIDEEDAISAYRQGDFIDLCRGPHVPSTGKIKHFKLLSSAGAYWRGDEKNKMLQRIYGTAWFTKEELNSFLHMLEEAKKRDHRKLGKELEIFTFDEEVGPGLPLWLPNGTVLVDELENLAMETERKAGYQRVRTPHLTKGELYEKSGHLAHYKDSMYPAMELDGVSYYVKPMNCPHHHKIFASSPKSYRDMPLRLAEYGTCYRYEKSGQLFGLMRVRSMQMNDAHIYCTEDQFKEEFLKVINMYLYYFDVFGVEKYQMRLSLHDPENLGDKYVDEPELWLKTEALVREAMEEGEVPYVEIPGEAAFYGPKVDVQVWSAIGREFTLSTNQVDFAIPKRFELVYVDENNQEVTPLCIHRAPLSTHERFIGFLIEHFGGDFPLWLAPKQVVILPVSDKYIDYAKSLEHEFLSADIRVTVDCRSEKVGAKIRDAELKKIPVMLIVGEREAADHSASVRRRHEGDLGIREVDSLISDLREEIQSRRRS